MNNKKLKQHTIDFIFPIALFFVFAASSLVVLLLSANIYKNITESSDTLFTSRTCLSYITEKIRQNDEGGTGNIYLDSFDGCPSLVLERTYGEVKYHTYIYEDHGVLRELFLQDGIEASAKNGTVIMEVSSFTMEETAPGLLRFSCSSGNDSEETILVSIHSDNSI